MAEDFDITVTLRGKLAYFGLGEVAAALAPVVHAREGHRVCIDLRRIDFVSPAGMAMLRCALRHLKENDCFGGDSMLLLPERDEVRRYLRRMDILEGLVRYRDPEDQSRRDPQGFVPMETFSDEDEAGWAAHHVVQSFGLDDAQVALRLESHLGEMAENVVYHSGASEGFAIAQTWRGSGKIEFAIADHGIGIAESMRKNPRYSGIDDLSAVDAALQLGGSAIPGGRRGQGLWTVAQAVERNGGHLCIRTGAIVYTQQGESRTLRVTSARLPGTIVAMRFDLTVSLDINDILESVPQDDYGFVDFED